MYVAQREFVAGGKTIAVGTKISEETAEEWPNLDAMLRTNVVRRDETAAYVVTRAMRSGDRMLRPGEIVTGADWPNLGLLVRGGYLRPARAADRQQQRDEPPPAESPKRKRS